MLVLLILAFVSGACALLAVASFSHKPAGAARLEAWVGAQEGREGELRSRYAAPRRSLLEVLVAPFGRIAARGSTAAIREKLVQAGYRGDAAVVNYMGARLLLPLVLVMGMWVVCVMLGAEGGGVLGCIGGMVGLGYQAPSFQLDRKRKARQSEIRKTLPDALDLMVVCLEAGLGMGAALERVATEFVRRSPILCGELRVVNAEMRAGKATADALRGLAERVGITEVSSLVAMLVQTERFGTSVSDALRVHCDGMRTERVQSAEAVAQKAAVKMLLPAGAFIFPVLALVIIGPGAIQMIEAFSP